MRFNRSGAAVLDGLTLGSLALDQCPIWVRAALDVDAGEIDGAAAEALRGPTSQEAYYFLIDRGWDVERRRCAETGQLVTVIWRAPHRA